MADSRAKDLAKRAISSLASLTGVRLWSDKDGEADAKGIEVPELLNSGAVAEGSAIDYQAVTPKGFAASVATTSRKGIVEKATSAEMTSGASDKFPDAAQVKAADTAVKDDIGLKFLSFGSCNDAGSASQHSGSLTISGQKLGTGRYKINHNVGHTGYFVVITTATTESVALQNKVAGVWRGATSFVVNLGDDSSANNGWFEFAIIQYGYSG